MCDKREVHSSKLTVAVAVVKVDSNKSGNMLSVDTIALMHLFIVSLAFSERLCCSALHRVEKDPMLLMITLRCSIKLEILKNFNIWEWETSHMHVSFWVYKSRIQINVSFQEQQKPFVMANFVYLDQFCWIAKAYRVSQKNLV